MEIAEVLEEKETEIVEEVKSEEIESGSKEKETPPVDAKPSEVELLRQEVEKLKRHNLSQQEHVGKLRTRLSELKAQSAQSAKEAKEIKDEDPLKAAEKIFDSKQAENQAATLEQQIEFDEMVSQNKNVVLSRFPDFENMINDACEILKSEGVVSESGISDFKSNPFATNTGVLLNLARAVQLNRENQALKQKIETNANKSEEVFKDIEIRANKRSINNSSGGTNLSSQKTFSLDKSVSAMTREELEELKKRLRE